MTILIIDTSKPRVWIALADDIKVMAEKEWEGDRTLGTKLLEIVKELTVKKRPDRIAVHRGPGHFMSLRAGIVTAQLLAQAWEVDLVSVEGQGCEEMIQQAIEGKGVEVVKVSYDQTPPAA